MQGCPANYPPFVGPIAVADLEIQKGGFSTGARSAPANFLVATPTFGRAGSPN